ncbi:Uncharacterized protein BM_BM14201, partial [Brugia malayi]
SVRSKTEEKIVRSNAAVNIMTHMHSGVPSVMFVHKMPLQFVV